MQAMHRAVCSSSAAASYQLVGKSPVRLLGHFSDCHKVPSSLSPVCQCLTDVDRELGWGDGAASLVFSQTAPWVCICSRQFVGCWLFLSNWQCCSNASPPSKPVAPKETWTAIFLLPPFSLLLMPGWAHAVLLSRWHFSRAALLCTQHSQKDPKLLQRHLLATAEERALTVCCVQVTLWQNGDLHNELTFSNGL